MKTIKGKLDKVKHLWGVSEDLEVIVDGNKFYITTTLIDKKMVKELVGKKIEIEYSSQKTSLLWGIVYRAFLISFGIPQKYNEIEKISEIK